jgi:hypothetical protein
MSSFDSELLSASAIPESNDAEARVRRVNELKDRYNSHLSVCALFIFK